MLNDEEDTVVITQEACAYLRISRPTYVKYLVTGKIKGTRAGRGWKVLKSELDQFLKGEYRDWVNSGISTDGPLGKNLFTTAIGRAEDLNGWDGEKG